MVDDLNAALLQRTVTGAWGASVDLRATTESTMDDAMAAAKDGAPDGHAIVADTQTRGRGAHGRSWESPPGSDLYVSVVSRPRVEPASIALVTLATGLGVADAVSVLLPGRDVNVKWPNDVWVGRRKCSGILVESRTVGSQIDAVIVGIGINVNRTKWAPALRGIATSLRAEADVAFDRTTVLAEVLTRAEGWVRRLEADGPAPVVHALTAKLALVGEPVRWEEGRGVFRGLGPDGAALVQTSDGTQSLRAARIEPIER